MAVAVERDALGTTARVAFRLLLRHGLVVGTVDRVRRTGQTSQQVPLRIRNLRAVHGGRRFTISSGLAEAISVALAAAR